MFDTPVLAPDSSDPTRARLLEAAGEVFAEQGYNAATVRDICGRAGANLAAVNYHFGGKEGLYREVLAYTGRVALEKYPIAAGVTPDSPAGDRLRAFIHTYLNRLLDEGRPAWHGRLIAREIADPTPAIESLVEQFVRPQYLRLREIVIDLLGPGAPDETVRWCCCSVVGQCLFHKQCRPVIDRLMPEQGYDPAARARLADHITCFSLAAIRAARGQAADKGGKT